MSVTAIVPAWNAAASLAPCLAALRQQSVPLHEVIVFDDGSTDATAAIAAAAGATMLGHHGTPLGPAAARNRGAQAATGDVLLFVDADVVLAPTALEHLLEALQQSGAAAAFGSYDCTPLAPRASSRYANLRHHYMHQMGASEATTFWAGIGLVVRRAFVEVGGFDAAQFARPSIEDIELGSRLRGAGYRIRLVADAQGTHWKDWTVLNLWRTDIVARALPWARLIADGRASSADLNGARVERARASAALVLLLALAAALIRPATALAALAALGAYLWLNRAFFRLLAQRAGARAAVVGMALHWCYHLYASIIFVAVVAATRLGWRARVGRVVAA